MGIKKKNSKSVRGVNVELMDGAQDAVEWVSSWSRYNRKEIVNAAMEALPLLGQDVVGALIGQLPESRRPDFARMILQKLAKQPRDVLTPETMRLARDLDEASRVAETKDGYVIDVAD